MAELPLLDVLHARQEHGHAQAVEQGCGEDEAQEQGNA